MNWICGTDRFKRAAGELFHKRLRLVWLLKDFTVTVDRQPGRAFGQVVEDSIYPDDWVTVDILDKFKFAEWQNRNVPKAIQGAVKLRTIKQLKERKLAGPRGPYPYSFRKKLDPVARGLVWVKCEGRCYYCFKKMVFMGKEFHGTEMQKSADNFTVDHLQPLIKGGTNDPSNLVGCCQRCNILKGELTEAEFREKHKGRLENGKKKYEKERTKNAKE